MFVAAATLIALTLVKGQSVVGLAQLFPRTVAFGLADLGVSEMNSF